MSAYPPGAPGTRIPRRKPSQLRDWRQAQYEHAPDPGAKLLAAWDKLLRPAIKAQPDVTAAGDLVRQATRALNDTAAAMDALLPVTPKEVRRREWRRQEFTKAATAWDRMASAYGWVLSSAKVLGTLHGSEAERARRAGERDHLLATLAAGLARIASRARNEVT